MVSTMKTVFPTLNAWQNKRTASELKTLDNLVNQFWEKIPQRKTVNEEIAREYLNRCNQELKRKDISQKHRAHFRLVRDLCISTLECNSGNKAERSLYEKIDIAIEILEHCQGIDLDSLCTHDKEALDWLVNCCRRFISAIADKTSITDDEINSIKEKRHLDFTYLPNHLPSHLSEPQCSDKNKPFWGLSREELIKYYAKIKIREFKREHSDYFKQIDTALQLYGTWANRLQDVDNNEDVITREKEKSYIKEKQEAIKKFLSKRTGKIIKTDQDVALIKKQRRKNSLYPHLEKIDAAIKLFESCDMRLNESINLREREEIQAKQKDLLALLSKKLKQPVESLKDVHYLKKRRQKNSLFPILDEEENLNAISSKTLDEIFQLKFKEKRIKDTFQAYKNRKLLRVNKTDFLRETLPKSLLELKEKLKNDEAGSVDKKVISVLHAYEYYDAAVKAYRRFKEINPQSPNPFDPRINLDEFQINEEDEAILNIIRAQNLKFDEIVNPFDPLENQQLLMKYLNTAEREKFRLFIHSGGISKFVEGDNGLERIPASTKGNRSHSKDDWVSFVMTNKGEIFAGSHVRNMSYLHSSFSNGSWVLFAGEMKIDTKGKITGLSVYSGHYEPTVEQLIDFARHLESKNVDLSRCIFSTFNAEKIKEKANELKILAEKKLPGVGILIERFEREKEQMLQYSIPHKYRPAIKSLNELYKIPHIEFKHIKELLKKYRSFEELQKASIQDIAKISGINVDMARHIHASLVSCLIPIQPLSLKTKFIFGAGILLTIVGISAMIAIPFLFVGALALVGFISGVFATVTAAIVLAKATGLIDKCLTWFRQSRNNKMVKKELEAIKNSPPQLTRSQSAPSLLMYKTLQPSSASKIVAEQAILTRSDLDKNTDEKVAISIEKNTAIKASEKPIQMSFIEDGYTEEDAMFGAKWSVPAPKSDYPEWCIFIEHIRKYIQQNNFARINVELTTLLSELSEKFYDNQLRKKNTNPPLNVWIWKEENLIKLFTEIARETLQSSDLNSLEKLSSIEIKVFMPIISTVYSFISKYRSTAPIKIYEQYLLQKREILKELFATETVDWHDSLILSSENQTSPIPTQV